MNPTACLYVSMLVTNSNAACSCQVLMVQNTNFNEIVPCLHSTDKQSGQQQVHVEAVYNLDWVVPATYRHTGTCGLVTLQANSWHSCYSGDAAINISKWASCGHAHHIFQLCLACSIDHVI